MMFWKIERSGPDVVGGTPTRWRPWGTRSLALLANGRRSGKDRRRRTDLGREWLHRTHWTSDDGMTTAEYAIGTVAAAALAAILYTVVTGDSIVSGLTSLIQRALTVAF
ncbi:DUF4244 domain-containing protein [Amycolatopsis taiwanensis]|uniref:DUF4244 domain-containing protein n=1 Tax=Amycolatopsis taiwanensis TaxID=342230 RepID=A0A9W6R6Q2_9PSEU|nr:hypothetical protein Atai01_52310 [Amycolatopsis taiwanensis]